MPHDSPKGPKGDSSIMWGAPPPKRSGSKGRRRPTLKYRGTLDALKARPGEWGLVYTHPDRNHALKVRIQLLSDVAAAYVAPGRIEAVTRKTDEGIGVWAKYDPAP